ncbi:TPA: hypothetical protein DCL28_00480, partial [Candidatus Komeilibacteria bacterium]|nr:hypothetical protein [Candidatus Komeilibacteria bacterium]HCC73691.1 hypothetical protein [Candidatus Komeilibacteria bacterium]
MNFLIKYSPGRILGLFLLISVLSLSNGPAVLAVWQEPTQDPPGGNRPVPLDVSATAQTKAGGLTIQGAAAFTGGVTADSLAVTNAHEAISAVTTGASGVTDFAVHGTALNGGWAGYFQGPVLVTGSLQVGTGSSQLCLNSALAEDCISDWSDVQGNNYWLLTGNNNLYPVNPATTKIGIGVAGEPLAPLHIKADPVANRGQLELEGYSGGLELISFYDDPNGYMGYISVQKSQPLKIQNQQNGVYGPISLNPAGGNVGIHNDAPGYPLDVIDDNSTAIVNLNNTNPKLWTGFRIAIDGVEQRFIGLNNTDSVLRFRRNGTTDDLVINTNGYVGVGTVSPLGKLSVEGSIFSRTGLTDNLVADPQFSQAGTYWSNSANWLEETAVLDNGDIVNSAKVTTSGNVVVVSDFVPVDPYKTYRFSIWIKSDNATAGARYFGLYSYNENKQAMNVFRVDGASTGNPYFWSGDLILNTWRQVTGYVLPCNSGDGWINPADTTNVNYRMDCQARYLRLRFLNYGNAGTTVTNWFALPAVEEVQSSAVAFSKNYSDYIINPAGNVGINTIAPNKLLEIADNELTVNVPTVRITNAAYYGGYSVPLNEPHGALEFYSTYTGGNYPAVTAAIKAINESNSGIEHGLGFFVNNNSADPTEVVRINENGTVGINNITPDDSYKLDVNGSVNSTGGYCINGDCLTDWADVQGDNLWTDAGTYIRPSATANLQIDETSGELQAINANVVINGGHLDLENFGLIRYSSENESPPVLIADQLMVGRKYCATAGAFCDPPAQELGVDLQNSENLIFGRVRQTTTGNNDATQNLLRLQRGDGSDSVIDKLTVGVNGHTMINVLDNTNAWAMPATVGNPGLKVLHSQGSDAAIYAHGSLYGLYAVSAGSPDSGYAIVGHTPSFSDNLFLLKSGTGEGSDVFKVLYSGDTLDQGALVVGSLNDDFVDENLLTVAGTGDDRNLLNLKNYYFDGNDYVYTDRFTVSESGDLSM